MILKVRHEELKEYKNVMKKDSELLNTEIHRMLKTLDDLQLIWQGEDSDRFYKNAHDYIMRMKTLPNALNTMGDFINKVDDNYSESDEMFAKELREKV